MGLYLQAPQNFGKLDFLLELLGGSRIDAPDEWMSELDEDCLICVVDNGVFQAAGICVDEAEFRVFAEATDLRPKEWALIPRVEVVKYLRAGGFPDKELIYYGVLKEGE